MRVDSKAAIHQAEHDARQLVLLDRGPQCTVGHGHACSSAPSPPETCDCACGGANHGRAQHVATFTVRPRHAAPEDPMPDHGDEQGAQLTLLSDSPSFPSPLSAQRDESATTVLLSYYDRTVFA